MRNVLMLWMVMCAVLPLAAQEETIRFERAVQRVDELARREMTEDQTPGMVIAITDRKGLLHLGIYGLANRDSREPVTANTLFGIGSIGKSFTAVSTLKLHDEGKLDYQAPLTKYLPWFTVKSTVPITAQHLLSHTAGLPNMRMDLRSSIYQAYWLTKAPLTFEPGKQWHYSSAGYDVLSTLIAALSHETYGEFIQTRVFDPLGMTHSEPVAQAKIRPRMAMSYEPLFDDRPADPRGPMVAANYYEYGGGAGSIASTGEDMAAYVRMLLNRGEGPHGRLISEESFKLLTQHIAPRGPSHYYGYGIETSSEDGHSLISHGGGVQGFRSFMLCDLDEGLGVVILANGPLRPDLSPFVLHAAEAALHGREIPALPNDDQPDEVANAADYAGTYTAVNGETLTFGTGQGHLNIIRNGAEVPLVKKGIDRFLCPTPEFAYYLLQFAREKGGVTEVSYGNQWYANERYSGPRDFKYPREWNAYPGHYRTSSREHVNYRIILRKGKLWLESATGDESPLVPLPNGMFRVADTPEWVSFAAELDGKMLIMNYSGSEYGRDFTP